jgi:MFS family permease
MTDNDISRHLLRDKNLHIIFLITLMAVLGVASLIPAFPEIIKQLAVPKQYIGLLIIVFTLPGVLLTPLFGVLADRFGRKTVLVPSLFLFGIAGGLCGFIRDFEALLVLRFFQGVGAASLGALNVTIIGDLFDGKKRLAAMGYNASVLSIATASYPFIGGALASFKWFYPFFLPFLALPVALIVLFALDTPKPSQTEHLSTYLKNLAASLKNKRALLYFFISMMVFVILYGAFLTYLPIHLAEKFQFNAMQIGLIGTAMSFATALTSPQTRRIARRVSERSILLASFIFYGTALVLLPLAPSIPLLLLPVVLYGIGQGLNIPTLQTTLTGLAPIQFRAAFMSMNGMVLRLGQTLGPIIMGAVFVLGGLTWTFFAGAFCAFLMFAALFLFDRK